MVRTKGAAMIKKVRIRDFKSIRDLTVELDPVTVLVGRSGTGKSNFVQALRFLRNCVISLGNAPAYEGGWPLIVPAGEARPSLVLEVEFSVESTGATYRYKLCFDVPGGRDYKAQDLNVCEELLSYDSKPLYHRMQVKGDWRWEVAPPTVAPVNPTESLAIHRMPALSKVVHAYTALASGLGYYSLPTSVWSRFTNGAAGPRDQILRQLSGMKDDGSNYLHVMREIAQNLHQPQVRASIFASLRRLNSTVASVELDSITNPQRAVVGHSAGDRVLELGLDQESDGFRRFYAQLLALYQLPPKLTNIFEEPENGVYPGALALLADEFKAAPHNGRGQVILTTHSPALLDEFDVESLRVVDFQDGQTVIGKVSTEQRDAIRQHLLTTGELLTADPARLDEATANVETGGA